MFGRVPWDLNMGMGHGPICGEPKAIDGKYSKKRAYSIDRFMFAWLH